LTYEFPVRKPDFAVVEMRWEDLAVAWTVKVEKIEDLYISKMKHELNSRPGFSWQGYDAAAQYALQANTHLEQGLAWAESAVAMPFIGQANFRTLSTKAQLQARLGQEAEAKKTMDAAINSPGTLPTQIHVYGRQLMAQKKFAEALAVFELNQKRNGDAWPVHVGLARAYSATGDLKRALEHAEKALAQAPDELNRKSLAGMVEDLKQGKPVAQ
jgi:tetratricopeptide (TPR) repeat protein